MDFDWSIHQRSILNVFQLFDVIMFICRESSQNPFTLPYKERLRTCR